MYFKMPTILLSSQLTGNCSLCLAAMISSNSSAGFTHRCLISIGLICNSYLGIVVLLLTISMLDFATTDKFKILEGITCSRIARPLYNRYALWSVIQSMMYINHIRVSYLAHPVSSQVHEILDHLRTILGTDRFWMELNTPNRQTLMPEGHDCFVGAS